MALIATNYASRVDEYVRGRPEYPLALLSDLPLADAIVDLGAGTGKFTRLLSLAGRRVIAIEPVERMAARIASDRAAGIDVLIAKAEAIPLADSRAGFLACATSFHWFDYGAAMAEIARVLRPDGALALLWNARDERVPWVSAFSRVLDDYAGATPRRASGRWRAIFDDPRFAHVASRTYPFTQPMPPEGIADRALSTSFIAALPAAGQDIVRRRIAALIAGEPALAGRREIEFPYVTELYVFRRRGEPARRGQAPTTPAAM